MGGVVAKYKPVKRIVDHMETLGKRIHVAAMPHVLAARNLISGISEAKEILVDSKTPSHYYRGINPTQIEAIKTSQLPDLRNYLMKEWNIYIKDCSSKFNNGRAYVRFAVRLPEDNIKLVKALSKYNFITND